MKDIIDRGIGGNADMYGAAIFLHSRHSEIPSNFCVVAKSALKSHI